MNNIIVMIIMIMIIGKEFKATKNTLVIFWKRYCVRTLSSDVSKIPIEVLFLVATFNALPFSINIIAIIIIILLHSLNNFFCCFFCLYSFVRFSLFLSFVPIILLKKNVLAVQNIRKPQVTFVFAVFSS